MHLFHGSRASSISTFKIPSKQPTKPLGELRCPVQCIWLSDSFEVAKHHAKFTLGGGYVHVVDLLPNVIIADTLHPENLASEISKKIVKKNTWFGEHFFHKYHWFSAINKNFTGSAIEDKNFLFKNLLEAGVDLLANPNVSAEWNKKEFSVRNYPETHGGITYALLDVHKVIVRGGAVKV